MLFAALVACSPCTSFSDMTYSGPEEAELSALVAEFAGWTGREGVCVPSVAVVDEIDGDPDLLGLYSGAGSPIVLARATGSYGRVLRHELCHALDDQEALAETTAYALDSTTIDVTQYPSSTLRLAEAFALACQDGPADLSFGGALELRCGLEVDPADAALRAAVYREVAPDPRIDVGSDPRPTPLPGLPVGRILDVAGAQTGAWLALADVSAPQWWPADGAAAASEPPGEAWTGTALTVAQPDGTALRAWYARGAAGGLVGTAEGWVLSSDCGLSTSGAIPAWVGNQPSLFTNTPSRARYTW